MYLQSSNVRPSVQDLLVPVKSSLSVCLSVGRSIIQLTIYRLIFHCWSLSPPHTPSIIHPVVYHTIFHWFICSTHPPFSASQRTQRVNLSSNISVMQQDPVLVSVSQNATSGRSAPTGAGVTMTLGILFNVVALIILVKAYNRFRRRSKATFLLCASSLVATDLAGHVINGALVLRMYSLGAAPPPDLPHSFPDRQMPVPDATCLFLGGCMVFFGLCPLFLGCVMAVERCLGVTRPLLHARLVTTVRTKMALALIWLLALCVAILPFFSLGTYTYQHPGTWCFLRVTEGMRATDMAFVLLFSGLALSSLALAFVCNTVSGMTLVRARLKKMACTQRCSAKSHDTEMVVQLVGIMVTSCICWTPLLVSLKLVVPAFIL